ncbi:uncharacterized protein LOC123310338 [Coccinella septempunctata]|uniref:uncharacterized protein LOC123310338 n=1 Tax=Coccinella septempunctata TaxID=41139 RepID=UPI001D06A491|nr:uncharacterized protein LOC123310338 [Coccinella septempunctata]
MFMKEWSNNNRKIAGLLNRKIFLLECKRLKLTPNHIGAGVKSVLSLFEFYVGNKFNRRVTDFNKKLVHKLLSLEVEHTHLKISHVQKEKAYIEEKLEHLVPSTTLLEFYRRQQITYKRIFNKIKTTNLNKVKNLQMKSYKTDYRVKEKWFKNLSTMEIPEEVKTVLSLGGKFSVPINPREVKVKNLIADVEGILDTVEEDIRDTLRAKTTNIITSFLHRNKNVTNHSDQLYKTTKEFLKTNDHLLVLNSDKGSVTVLMEKTDYLDRMYSIINTDSFKRIPKDPTATIQKKTNTIITTLEKRNIISKEQGRSMRTYNSISPRMYGNPKVHKNNFPMRPIVSDIQGPTIKLSRYVAQILTAAYDQNNPYYVKDSFDFSTQVSGLQLPPEHVVISLDVVNLFGNISKGLVLTAIDFNWDKIEPCCGMSREDFKEIISFLLDSGCFDFMTILPYNTGARIRCPEEGNNRFRKLGYYE